MSGVEQLPAWAVIVTAALLVVGAAISFIGALGLLRLEDFYQRVHAPTLGTTLGTASIALASMVYFSALESRPALRELLIVAFITVTTPITLTVLVRAARFRDTAENADGAPNKDGGQ